MSAADSARAPIRRGRVDRTRLIAGVGLVVASVIGVGALVTQANRTTVALAARHVLAAGDVLGEDDLLAVHVRLGTSADAYLAAAPAPGSVITRTIEEGELVPRAALQTADAVGTTSVVLAVDGALPASVTAGASVDVWATRAARGAEADAAKDLAPIVLVSGATVVRVVRDDGFAGSRGTAVEVRVPRETTAAVLAAVAAGDAVSVLPASVAPED